MRKLTGAVFLSLDGVMQAPGGPDEDPSGGFRLGGWVQPFWKEDMGPFEIALGTQWDRGEEFDHEMFPDKSLYGRYEERAVRKYPQMGDVSARSALTSRP